MQIVLIIIGIGAVGLAWVLIYRTTSIYKFNAWVRESIFSDQWVLFSGRRLAFLLLILGGISLFSGIEYVTRTQPIKPRIAARLLKQAEKDFFNEKHENVIYQCKELIRSDPKNLRAQELMAGSLWAAGNREEAQRIIEAILNEDPNYPIKKGPLAKLVRTRKEQQRK
jgi:cytochrome c-type biogenesis protein CcmH/NrfG